MLSNWDFILKPFFPQLCNGPLKFFNESKFCFEKHWVSQVLVNFPTTKSQAQLFLSKTVARYTKQINQAQLKYELKQLY